MTSEIYAVIAYGGSYDEAWEAVKVTSFDLVKAEAYVAEREARNHEVAQKYKEYGMAMDALKEGYVAVHPEPATPAYELVQAAMREVPKWTSLPGQKQVITDEMRAERVKILKWNAEKREEMYGPTEAWSVAFDIWRKEQLPSILAKVGLTEEEVRAESTRFGEVTQYRIESVPVI